MIEQTQTIAELFKALNAAQSRFKGVHKDKTNSHFRNKYAPLDAVLDAVRVPLHENGLAISQSPGRLVDGCIEITTTLGHVSGEWMRSTLHMPIVKRDPQGVGAAITYGQRYSIMAILGIPPTDDDDAEAAIPDRGKPAPQAPSEKPQNKTSTELDVRAWVKEVERCASRSDLNVLFRSEAWAAAKAVMSPEGQKIVQDALAQHPEYQGRAA